MHNYLTWLLHSPPARAPYVVLFNLKLLIQDGNLQVCMYCMHAQKRASGAPRTHFRAWKISKFPGCMPPTPLTQSILQAPLFVFALAPPPNPLGYHKNALTIVAHYALSLHCSFSVNVTIHSMNLLLSVLRVRSMSNNANSNERVIFFSSIAWYYGDNDFITRTFDFIARSDTARDLHYLIQILT